MSKLKVDELEESTSGSNITVNTGSDLIVDDNIQLGHDSDTTLARASAGDISVEGNTVYRAGGTDVAVADGGTGAGTATAGFDALSPMTTVGDIMYGGSSGTVTRLAASTDGHVLTSTGAGSAPAWEAAAAGGTGRWELLSTISASNASSAQFQELFSSTYDHYKVIGDGVYSSNNDSHLYFRVVTGTSSVQSSSYSNTGCSSGSDSSGVAGNNQESQSEVYCFNGLGNTSSETVSFEWTVYDPLSTSKHTLMHYCGGGYRQNVDGRLHFQDILAGWYGGSSTPVTGAVFFTSHNIYGTFKLYGFVK